MGEFLAELDRMRAEQPEPEPPPPPIYSAEQVAKWKAENTESRRLVRRLTTAGALEAATDIAGATAIYEALVREGCIYPTPYRRLAILYRKAKQVGDEERVVRAALGHVGIGINQWFVLRLAKMLGEKRRVV